MDEFSEFSSEVVEFPSTWENDRTTRLVNTSVSTDPLPPLKNQNIQTNQKQNIAIQTDTPQIQMQSTDEKKLSQWLKKIYPLVEVELSKGITPSYERGSSEIDENVKILPYQKISINSKDHTQGAATWLSVRTNNAPLFVVATAPIHTEWCDHVGQNIQVFTPKRIQSQDFVVFSELTSLPVKSCIKSFSTNSFNKDMFAGGTLSGDLYIWEHVTTANSEDVNELFCESTQHGCIIAMDWLNEDELLTCHSDGVVCLWKVTKELIKGKSFKINRKNSESTGLLTAILGISTTEFIVGSEEGRILLYSTSNFAKGHDNYSSPVGSELESHSFPIASLSKTKISGAEVVISCDLSGEIYFHDIRDSDDGPTLIVKMPLPFKNAICCSEGANFIFCPGVDGSLEVFNVSNGKHFIIDGTLEGKSQFIKISDNNSWIITGVYEGNFQIFKLDY